MLAARQQASDGDIRSLREKCEASLAAVRADAKARQGVAQASLESVKRQQRLRADQHEQELKLAVADAVHATTQKLQQSLGGRDSDLLATLQQQLASSNLQVAVSCHVPVRVRARARACVCVCVFVCVCVCVCVPCSLHAGLFHARHRSDSLSTTVRHDRVSGAAQRLG
jgi:hypothetical protein